MTTGSFTTLLSSDILIGGAALVIAAIYFLLVKPRLKRLRELEDKSPQDKNMFAEFELYKTAIVETIELLMKNNTLEIKGEINNHKENLSAALEKLKKQENTLEIILERNRKILSNTRHVAKNVDILSANTTKLIAYLNEVTKLITDVAAELRAKNLLDSDLSGRFEKMNSILNDSQRDVDTLMSMVHELIEQVGAGNIDRFDIDN